MKDFLIQKYIDYKFKHLKKDDKFYESKLLNKKGIVLVNHKKLDHICLRAGTLPKFFMDKPFRCKDCNSQEIWKAEKQKNYFEEMKGKHLGALAIRCKNCRIKENLRIAEQKQHMKEMSDIKPHKNVLFFKDLENYKNSNK